MHTEYTGFHQGTLVIHRCTPVKKFVHRIPYSIEIQTVVNDEDDIWSTSIFRGNLVSKMIKSLRRQQTWQIQNSSLKTIKK